MNKEEMRKLHRIGIVTSGVGNKHFLEKAQFNNLRENGHQVNYILIDDLSEEDRKELIENVKEQCEDISFAIEDIKLSIPTRERMLKKKCENQPWRKRGKNTKC